MKFFIKKTLIFICLPLLALIFIISTLNFINYNRAYTKRFDKSSTTVFCGDSHIELAINDSLMRNSVNVAKSSESFYFSYYKLKVMLNKNPSIKQVYLGISYHSLSSYY